jgi:hypothetical protein
MFARPSSHAYICLRCQSRQLRRRPNTSLVASTQRSPFSAVHPRPSPPDDNVAALTSLPLHRVEDHTPENGGQRTVPLSNKPVTKSSEGFTAEHPYGRKRLGKGSWYVLGKVRGRPGGETREGSTALSIDSLGKPTEIILLRDLGLEQTEKEVKDNIHVDKQDFSQEAIIKSIEYEKRELDQATINAQIDRLRSTASGSRHAVNLVTAAEYAKLGKKLTIRFTVVHLREYCRVAVEQSREHEEKGSTEQTGTADMKISLNWSPWRKGTTPIGRRPPQGPKPISLIRNWGASTKNELIRIIIQSIWNIHVAAEQSDEIGELEVKLKPWEVDLFTAGSKHTTIEHREGSANAYRTFSPSGDCR